MMTRTQAFTLSKGSHAQAEPLLACETCCAGLHPRSTGCRSSHAAVLVCRHSRLDKVQHGAGLDRAAVAVSAFLMLQHVQ